MDEPLGPGPAHQASMVKLKALLAAEQHKREVEGDANQEVDPHAAACDGQGQGAGMSCRHYGSTFRCSWGCWQRKPHAASLLQAHPVIRFSPEMAVL